MLQSKKMVALGLALTLSAAPIASAESKKEAPVTPATGFHGTPGNTPGYGGKSANPNGNGRNGGGGIHGIANNPGQSGFDPNADGNPGFNDNISDRVHGGLNPGN